MKISKQWLGQFVDLSDLSSESVAKELKYKTVEVEDVFNQGEDLENVVVGKVTSAEQHPDADRLLVCQVDAGDEEVQIVCGGSNVKEGMLIALGKIGAQVRWHGEGDPIELKKTKIRGVESYGMICAAEEIGLGDMFEKKDEKEILDISHLDVTPGTSLAEALSLNDVVFDIENKSLSNRPDLWGHYGIAREVGAIFKKDLQEYTVPDISEASDVQVDVSVEDTSLCLRYMAVAMDGITIAPAPMWMQQRLVAAGVRPINNIVDITNYVMLELGQPMHAFNLDQLTKNKEQLTIFVRNAKKNEKMELLDGDTVEMSEDMLVIADSDNAIAVAGVMGGAGSQVTESTNTILFEAANFDAVSMRRTATALGLRTESSSRFEKSLDPYMAEIALKRAVELVLELVPDARVVSQVADEKHMTNEQKRISFPVSLFEEKIGTSIDTARAKDLLERLGFVVQETDGQWDVTVPTWRATKDIDIPEDIVEEVARMYGYEHIPSALPTFSIASPKQAPTVMLKSDTKKFLAYEHGLTEVYNYSYVSPEWIKKIGFDPSAHIELANPIAKDRPLIRRSLVPGLLENIEKNLHRFDRVRLFEIGRVYKQEEKGDDDGTNGNLPRQDILLGLAISEKDQEVPFFAISEVVRSLGRRLGVSFELVSQKAPEMTFAHPGRTADVMVEGQNVGYVTELHPKTGSMIGIDERVALAEINLSQLVAHCQEVVSYDPVSIYPGVERDIAFVVDRSVEHVAVVQEMRSVDPLIQSVELFDVYEGEHVPEGNKSMAYHIEYRSDEKTLTTEEAENVHTRLLQKLKEAFNVTLRQS